MDLLRINLFVTLMYWASATDFLFQQWFPSYFSMLDIRSENGVFTTDEVLYTLFIFSIGASIIQIGAMLKHNLVTTTLVMNVCMSTVLAMHRVYYSYHGCGSLNRLRLLPSIDSMVS